MYPRLDNPVNQYFLRDLQGNLLPGGRMDFYDSATDTPANVYAPGDPSTPLGYQIEADAYGLLPDFQLEPNKDYIIRVYDSDSVFQWERDGVANNITDLEQRVSDLESAVAALGSESGLKNLLTNGGCKAVRDDRLGLGFGVQTSFAEGELAGIFARVTSSTAGTFQRIFDTSFSTSNCYSELNNVTTDNSAAVAEIQWRMPSGDGAAISGDDVVFQVKVAQNSGSPMNCYVTLYKCDAEDDFSNLTTVTSSSVVSVESGDFTTLTLQLAGAGDLTTGVAVVVTFDCGIVSNVNMSAGEAQLERGLIATQFEDRPQFIDQAAWSKYYLTPDLLPVGLLGEFPLAAPNAFWLRCNGQAVSRTDYPRLFAYLGETYGNGDGSTTFNLPDYRGYAKRDTDDGAGVDPDAAGRTDRGDGTTGDNVGTKQADELAAHDHTYPASYTNSTPNTVTSRLSASNDAEVTVSETGGNETRMKNINVNTYIHI